jgi:hypothetical protein
MRQPPETRTRAISQGAEDLFLRGVEDWPVHSTLRPDRRILTLAPTGRWSPSVTWLLARFRADRRLFAFADRIACQVVCVQILRLWRAAGSRTYVSCLASTSRKEARWLLTQKIACVRAVRASFTGFLPAERSC